MPIPVATPYRRLAQFLHRFFLHEESLRSHGPLFFRIAAWQLLSDLPITQAGDMEYRKPIPDSWIPAPGPVDIALDVDPPWRLPDGTTLAFAPLHRLEKRRNDAGSRHPVRGCIHFLSCLALGKLLIKKLGLQLYRYEELFLGFF